MDTLLSFGSGDRVYNFTPDNQTHLSDNFVDLVTRTNRMVGVSGGFDDLGAGPAPHSVGSVRLEFWLHADSESEMSRKKLELGAMSSFGVSPLVMQPMDTSLPTLYCDARMQTPQYAQSAVKLPRQQLKVSLHFNVAMPGWLGQGTEAPLWNGGAVWSGGSVWGGTAVPVHVVGVSNDISISPGGNAQTYPRLFVSIPTLKSAQNVTIQRIMDGQVIDQVAYNTTLVAGDALEINTRAKSVTLNGGDAYNSFFTNMTVPWLLLLGGVENTVRVLMDNPTDEANVTIKYFEVHVS